MLDLKGKFALITGGSTGIGLESAKALAEAGARVAIVARSEEDLKKGLETIPGDHIAIAGDVTSPQDLDRVYKTVKDKFGSLDIVFANAGIAEFIPISDVTEDHFDRLINVNVKGAYFTVQKSLPLLNKDASIILTTSAVNKKGFPGTSIYSVTKAGLRSLARTLSAELVEQGIRVNAVSPGPIETPIFGKLGLPQEALDGFSQEMEQNVPLKRFGQPREVANAVVFLASSASSFIVGSEIDVDGGITQL